MVGPPDLLNRVKTDKDALKKVATMFPGHH